MASFTDNRLLSLCKLWNAVRFVSPELRDEGDGHWDEAALSAITQVESDPNALSKATAEMLATLGDPETALVSPKTTDPPHFSLRKNDEGGFHEITLRGVPAPDELGNAASTIRDALRSAVPSRPLLVDLRIGGVPTAAQRVVLRRLWSRVGLASLLAGIALPDVAIAARESLGFPSEGPGADPVYHSGLTTTTPIDELQPLSGTQATTVAFVVDATSYVPPEATLLAASSRAAIFSEDGTNGDVDGDHVTVDAGFGIYASLRTAGPTARVSARAGGIDAARTWLRAPSSPAAIADLPPPYLRFSDAGLPDEKHRILAVFRIWGTIAYSSPYRALAKDWDRGALAAFAEMRRVTTSDAYDTALRHFYARLADSHGYIYGPTTQRRFGGFPPIAARQIEGRVVVTAALPNAIAAGVRVGDVVDAVDNEPVAARAARLAALLPASTPQSLAEILDSLVSFPTLFAGPEGSDILLSLHGADRRQRRLSLRRGTFPASLNDRSWPVVRTLPGHILYADLTRTSDADLEGVLRRLSAARALVLDLRGYPHSDSSELAGRLVSSVTPFALLDIPLVEFPQGVRVTDEDADDVGQQDAWRRLTMVVSPVRPRFRGRVVVLIDARAISAAEYAIMQFAASGAVLVGEPTSGADGDITAFCVPGGYLLDFSGLAVRFPNGRAPQGIGIRPNVAVQPTIQDVRNGRDAVLAVALRIAAK